MTLPSTITFPLRGDFEDFEDVDRYLHDLTFELQRMYEQLSQGVNGTVRSDTALQRSNWTPTLFGTTVAGTFTYNHQIGWVQRTGNITDIWFDVSWSASGAAAGNLFLELPYKVANSAQKPFSSALQTSLISYGGGRTVLSINAIPNTFRGEMWASGSGVTTINVPAAPGQQTGGQLIGHLRYMGVLNET